MGCVIGVLAFVAVTMVIIFALVLAASAVGIVL